MRGKRTQKEVAAGIDMDRSAYVNMENEKRGMGLDVAKRLAAYYKKPLSLFEPYITDSLYRLKLIEGDGQEGRSDLAGIAESIENLSRGIQLLVAEQERQADEQARQADEIAELRSELAPSLRRARERDER